MGGVELPTVDTFFDSPVGLELHQVQRIFQVIQNISPIHSVSFAFAESFVLKIQ